MIDTYIYNAKDTQRRESFNACLRSLHTMIDSHEFRKTHQPYSLISYYGKISNLSSATIQYPSVKGVAIPVIGYINGTEPFLVGFTDGATLTVNPIDYKRSYDYVHNEEPYEIYSTYTPDDYSTTEVQYREYDSGLSLVNTITTEYHYTQTDEDYYTCQPKVTEHKEYDYSKCDISIQMRI